MALFPSTLKPSLDGTNGSKLNGERDFDFAATGTASAGDVNGDGLDDLLVGASQADPGGQNSGAAYTIFGKAPSGRVKLTGTAAAQTLAGGSRNDTLSGGAGDDRLFGNAGRDTLKGARATTLSFRHFGTKQVDTITDFTHDHDRIALDNTVFKALKDGELPAGAFYAKPAAHDGDDRILYDRKTGALFYDSDGNKPHGHAAQQVATSSKGLALDAGDFLVV